MSGLRVDQVGVVSQDSHSGLRVDQVGVVRCTHAATATNRPQIVWVQRWSVFIRKSLSSNSWAVFGFNPR